jgi:ABC-type proline/glycine betaine transport system ATPase subunit
VQWWREEEDLIVQMGLGHCADQFVGGKLKKGISGGEKRRVSIAIQILADPLMLLLGEPTSGLDVCTASSVLDVLRALADEGRTIVMTAHQCRSDAIETFDRVLLLTRGGSVAYSGDGGNILPHFSTLGFNCGLHTNPADFILDLITVDLQRQEKEDVSRKRVEQLLKVWENDKCRSTVTCTAVEEIQIEVKDLKRARGSFLNIFTLVLRRSALNISRNPETVIARTSNVIGMAIVFALFFSPLQSNAEAVQTRMVWHTQYLLTLISLTFATQGIHPNRHLVLHNRHAPKCSRLSHRTRHLLPRIFGQLLWRPDLPNLLRPSRATLQPSLVTHLQRPRSLRNQSPTLSVHVRHRNDKLVLYSLLRRISRHRILHILLFAHWTFDACF